MKAQIYLPKLNLQLQLILIQVTLKNGVKNNKTNSLMKPNYDAVMVGLRVRIGQFIYYETEIIIYLLAKMDPGMQSAAELKKIFDSFDTDKSGYIDIKQLGSVASKLGKQIPAEELTAIMKKIDANKDGKISFGELQYWWKKGVEGKMMELVFLKAKSMKLTNLFKNKTTNLNFSSKNKGNSKPDRFDFRVHFGSFVPDAISLDAGMYLRGAKEAQLRKKVASFGTNVTEKSFGVVIKLNSKNPAQAKAAIDHAFNAILQTEDMPVKIESLEQNPYVNVKTYVRENDIIVQLKVEMDLQTAISPMATEAQAVIQEIGEGFYTNFDFSFSLNSTFDNLFSEPILSCLLRGFNFHFQVQATNSALGNIRKMVQDIPKLSIPAEVNLFTLIRCARFHLGIRSPDQLNTFLKKLGIQDIVGGLPNFKDFIEELSPMVKKMSQQKGTIFNLLYQFSRYLAKHVQNDVQIYALGGPVGTAFIRAQGKNASKVHSMLFNEV